MHLYVVTLYRRWSGNPALAAKYNQDPISGLWVPDTEHIFMDPTPAKECADEMVKWAEVQGQPMRVVRRRIWWTSQSEEIVT